MCGLEWCSTCARQLTRTPFHAAHSYVREWNTHAKTSLIAQTVLRHIVRTVPASVLSEVPDISEIVTHLQPYTERHFDVRRCVLAQAFDSWFSLFLRFLPFPYGHSDWTVSFSSRTC